MGWCSPDRVAYLEVSTCFGQVLQWILAWWPADEPRLALALDARTFCETLSGAGGKPDGSGLRHTRGLESGRGSRKGSLEVSWDDPAGKGGGQGARSRDVANAE